MPPSSSATARILISTELPVTFDLASVRHSALDASAGSAARRHVQWLWLGIGVLVPIEGRSGAITPRKL